MICLKHVVTIMKNRSSASKTDQNLRKYNDLCLKNIIKPMKTKPTDVLFEVALMQNVVFPWVLQGCSTTHPSPKKQQQLSETMPPHHPGPI